MERKPNLWIYNYDLEFELANQMFFQQKNSRFFPWYFLNRYANHYLPFTRENDTICCYEKPDNILLDALEQKTGKRVQYLELNLAGMESNSILKDIQTSDHTSSCLENYELNFWGISPLAERLFSRYSGKGILSHKRFNSKVLNAELRITRLPDSFQIPSLILKKFSGEAQERNHSCVREISKHFNRENLEHEMKVFHAEHGEFILKNAYGTSGKLSEVIKMDEITPKKLGRWLSWIKQSGGIVLEQKLEIEKEVSLQFNLTDDNVEFLTETELYTNPDGSYQGTMINLNRHFFSRQQLNDIKSVVVLFGKQGYRGPLGMDFIQTPAGELKLLEINARYTMGRVAYEWSRLFPQQTVGLFRTLFFDRIPEFSSGKLLEKCRQLEREFNVDITVVNCAVSTKMSKSMVSLFIAAATEQQVSLVMAQF